MIFFSYCLMKGSLIDGFHTLKNGWFCIMAQFEESLIIINWI